MFSLGLLLATLLSPDAFHTPNAEIDASTVMEESVRLRNGAAIVLHRQPAVPIVSLRLSVVATDPAGFAGAGHMIQHLRYPVLRERVSRVGGRVQIQRTSDAVVYTATGPASELQYLADLLISTLHPPEFGLDAILRAERELQEERLAEWETAPSHARSHLRAQLFPADISAAGTDRSATRFTGPSLADAWSAIYRPERVSVVAVGDVYLTDVQRAFEVLPPASQAQRLGVERDSVMLTALAPPQATRAWIATAYPATGLEPAAVTVAARLLGDHLRRRIPSAEVETEHWWTHHGQAIVAVLALPESELAVARQAIAGALPGLLREVGFLDVVEAGNAIRRELLFFSRTPERMAEVIGQFVDRSGDPNATEQFYTALDRLDDEDVREVLEELADRVPARVEIPPQVLQPRRRP